MKRSLVGTLAALAVFAIAATDASASFPGRNGVIAFTAYGECCKLTAFMTSTFQSVQLVSPILTLTGGETTMCLSVVFTADQSAELLKRKNGVGEVHPAQLWRAFFWHFFGI